MKKKKSLTFWLAATMTAIVAGTFFVCWLFNNIFLEKYYSYMKQKEMIETYQILYEACENGDITEDSFASTFQNLWQDENIAMAVFPVESQFLTEYNLGDPVLSSADSSLLLTQIQHVMSTGFNNSNVDNMFSGDTYSMYRQKDLDLGSGSEYLLICGNASDKYIIVMRTSVESLKDSAKITNRFFLWVGMGAIILGFIAILAMARNISKPIRGLSNISNKMAHLDFQAKYLPTKSSSMEVDELGYYMNVMSESLEKNITDLKKANIELQEDIQKKEKIDEMRKEFLSNVSHELKTPLALISGYAEGLKECINDDQESRDFYCEVIMDETDKMTKMVKKLLTLNQIEFGNDTVDLKCFDMTELIEGVIRANSLNVASKKASINFYNDGPAFVWGDEFKIEEVITNYVSNAFNHLEGDMRIDISYKEIDNKLRVSVFNTGKPIPEEELDKIWIKFYKVDKARTREYGGNGIGLSIVKAIMDSHHQACGAINHPDGVEFWMELDRNI